MRCISISLDGEDGGSSEINIGVYPSAPSSPRSVSSEVTVASGLVIVALSFLRLLLLSRLNISHTITPSSSPSSFCRPHHLLLTTGSRSQSSSCVHHSCQVAHVHSPPFRSSTSSTFKRSHEALHQIVQFFMFGHPFSTRA